MTRKDIKAQLLNLMIKNLETHIGQIREGLLAMKESRNNDTKSSAGDKYETGREMMQIEIDKFEMQLYKSQRLKKELCDIPLDKTFNLTVSGSLVFTNAGTYLISVGIGRVELENEPYYAISLASPIGLMLKNKKVGDQIQFNGKHITIEEIV